VSSDDAFYIITDWIRCFYYNLFTFQVQDYAGLFNYVIY